MCVNSAVVCVRVYVVFVFVCVRVLVSLDFVSVCMFCINGCVCVVVVWSGRFCGVVCC